MNSITKRILFALFALACIGIGLYPLTYFIIERTFGLLASKSAELLADTFWNIGFYTHILLGGFALLIGWIQFSDRIRNKHLKFHRQIGKLYVIAALLSGTAGVYIGFYATGGIVSSAGFICLGLIWLYSTSRAYIHARNARINKHQQMMYFSYAACFAAVTLRIWLPLLTAFFGEFLIAYKIVAWLCWVPNILVAFYLVSRLKTQQT